MFGQLFKNSPLLVYPIVALAIFIGVFTIIVLRVYGKKASSYDGVSRLPLEDDEDGVIKVQKPSASRSQEESHV